jgi:hypothetical protein
MLGDAISLYRKAPADGTLWMMYYGDLPHLTALTETSQLPSRFHDLLPLHAAVRLKQSDGFDMNAKRDLQNDYYALKNDLQTYTNKAKRKRARRIQTGPYLW